jgi:hypothetical protein
VAETPAVALEALSNTNEPFGSTPELKAELKLALQLPSRALGAEGDEEDADDEEEQEDDDDGAACEASAGSSWPCRPRLGTRCTWSCLAWLLALPLSLPAVPPGRFVKKLSMLV